MKPRSQEDWSVVLDAIEWFQRQLREKSPDEVKAWISPPSAQAKCEQRALTADERDAIRRAYWKSVTPVASAQAREALDQIRAFVADKSLLEISLDGASKALPVLFTMCAKLGFREGATVADEINAGVVTARKELAHVRTLLRSLSANVGGGGVNRTTIRIEVLRALFEYATADKQFPIDEPFNTYLRETAAALAAPVSA